MEIITGFNYQALDAETRIVLQQRAVEIKSLVRRSVSDVVEVGLKLSEVRDKLSHNKQGGFKGWLQTEFTWSYETALNYIRVSDWAANNVNFTELDIAPSALYLLAGPSIPDEVRQEAIGRAEAGEKITHKKARVITGGIPKTTIEPLVADTAPVGYPKNQQTRHPSKAAYSSSDNQTSRGDDTSQVVEDDIDQTGSPKHHKSREEQAAIGLLETLGYSVIPPEAADDPTCAYCGKPFK